MSDMAPAGSARVAQIVHLLERALALADDACLTAAAARIAHALDTLTETRRESEVE
jgi:hypothetical protein